jgi:GNAT superfamily N-acetyltransferase
MTDPQDLLRALEATWPAASVDDAAAPGWRLRDGAGGGKRVSAASALTASPDIAVAEHAMRAQGSDPLFSLGPEDADIDAALATRGYDVVDPTVIYIGDAATLAVLPLSKGVNWVEVRASLALLTDIWRDGGIGPARRAVMDRCALPKATLMARTDASTAGCAFVAVDGPVAMVHAIEVRADRRRQGAGLALLAGAARIALDHGAPMLALAVTEANAGARRLYGHAGMAEVARYHYRLLRN